MHIIKSFAMILFIGIAAAGLAIVPAKAAQLLINSDVESATAEEKFVEGEKIDFTGGGQSDDFSWGGSDFLGKPLGDGFSLDSDDESPFRIQQILDDGNIIFGQ